MRLSLVARGALIGGGVGLLCAVVRRPALDDHAEHADHADAVREGTGRIVKSVAEGALAGAVVGFVLDRRLRARAAALIVEGAPVVVEAVTELARRYEPAVTGLAEVARGRAVDAYEVALPRVVEAYEVARPRVVEAYEVARPRVVEAYEVARPLLDEAAASVRGRAASRRSAS